MTVSLALLVAVSLAQPKAAVCPEGKSVSPDTQGQCCWPDQVWSGSRKACVGIPRCPYGLTAQGEDCKMVCPGGMEVGPDTQGHCCWPSQVWSGSRNACVGIPQCPNGLTAQGEACFAQAQPAPVPTPVANPPAPPPSDNAPPLPPPDVPPSLVAPTTVPGDQVIDGLTVPPGHHIKKKARLALLVPGVAVLGAGWLISVLTSIGGGVYLLFEPSNDCWRWASSVGWIPLVGPAIGIAGQDNPSFRSDGNRQCKAEQPFYSLGVGLAVVDTILQWGGLTMMILGLTLRQSVVVPDEPIARLGEGKLAPELYVNLGAQGTPFGLTLGLKTW